MSRQTSDMDAVASMTGYGRSTGDTAAGRVTAEVRSLNHRHLDVIVRSPRSLMSLEPEVKNLVRRSVSRGKVEVFLVLEGGSQDLIIDGERALEVAEALEAVAKAIGDKVRLEHILATGDVVRSVEREVDEKVAGVVLEATRSAIATMVEHRREEGVALALDLQSRMGELRKISEEIEELAPQAPARARSNMEQFLSGLETGERVEPQRLEMEVAILAQRSDIAEEITRLRTHQESFSQTLAAGGAIGRRLDFLIQEIQREINTIGSKSGVPGISERVVNFKTELEKVREQVQNIE